MDDNINKELAAKLKENNGVPRIPSPQEEPNLIPKKPVTSEELIKDLSSIERIENRSMANTKLVEQMHANNFPVGKPQGIQVSPTNAPQSLVKVDFEALDESIGKSVGLTTIERNVMDIVHTYFKEHRYTFTPQMVYRDLYPTKKRTHPKDTAIARITEILFKLSKISVWIDYKEHLELNGVTKGGEQITSHIDETPIIDIRRSIIKTDQGNTYLAYIMNPDQEPPLLAYSEQVNQVTTVPTVYYSLTDNEDIPETYKIKRMSDTATIVNDYIVRRILAMKHSKKRRLSNVIRVDTILKRVEHDQGKVTPKTSRTAKELITKILEYHKRKDNLLTSYQIQTKGRATLSYKIFF